MNARYISRLVCSSFFIREFVAIFLELTEVATGFSTATTLVLIRRNTVETDGSFDGDASDCVLEGAGIFCCIFEDLEIATGPWRLVEDDFEDPNRWVGTPIGADMASRVSSILLVAKLAVPQSHLP